MGEKWRPTNITEDRVTAVIHSIEDDPRQAAAMRAILEYERLFGLPVGTVWCDDAISEIERLGQ